LTSGRVGVQTEVEMTEEEAAAVAEMLKGKSGSCSPMSEEAAHQVEVPPSGGLAVMEKVVHRHPLPLPTLCPRTDAWIHFVYRRKSVPP
jgi:hypothetical protein